VLDVLQDGWIKNVAMIRDILAFVLKMCKKKQRARCFARWLDKECCNVFGLYLLLYLTMVYLKQHLDYCAKD
jgi:hypothetical protein